MFASIFIASLIGPVLLVVGAIAITNPKLLMDIGQEFMTGRALIFLAGIMALLAGLAIVNVHNIWTGWPVIITLFGWISIAAGIARMAFPDVVRKIGAKMITNESGIRIAGISQLLFGAFFAYVGYF